MNHPANHPVCLTVAGSDSGGGAGIQADIKTMTVLGCFATSAIAALTAQNGSGVQGIFAPPPEFAALQIQTVLDGFPVRAAKTGMLFNAPIIKAVADMLEKVSFPVVVDPVCVSQSGSPLLQKNALDALRRHMLPLAFLLTPNRPEAEALANMPIASHQDIGTAGAKLLEMGAKAVLIKGGHFAADDASCLTDWLCLPDREPEPLPQKRVDTTNNHGTGCTLSAAIAAFLAKGRSLRDSVLNAQAYLHMCMKKSYSPGIGAGPVNHLAPMERA